MSTTRSGIARTIERCEPEDATPVCIDAEDLDSTAPAYLRDLKYELASEGLVPWRLSVTACFEEDCSLATREEVERVREYVRAAAFLGAGAVEVEVEEVADEGKVRPALAACAERARREGVTLSVEGALSLES